MSRLQRWMHKLLGTHTYMSGTKCHRISEGRWQQQWQRNKVEILTEKDLNIANATTHESSAVAKSITITNTALIISELFLVLMSGVRFDGLRSLNSTATRVAIGSTVKD